MKSALRKRLPGDRAYHLERVLVFYDYLRIDGWLFLRSEVLEAIVVKIDDHIVHTETERIGLPSPGVLLDQMCGFSISCLVTNIKSSSRGSLDFCLKGGARISVDLSEYQQHRLDDINAGFQRFVDLVSNSPGARVLEIGSRARSGISRRELFSGANYTGIDVLEGENVDMIVDAHELTGFVEEKRFDFVFGLSIFEHLAMPWKVVLEINRIMKPGGTVFVATHQSCGMHDIPWDFWRFSDTAFRALFNRSTGFKILETRLRELVHVVPFLSWDPKWKDYEKAAGFYLSSVLARKEGETSLHWDVPLAEVTKTPYPA